MKPLDTKSSLSEHRKNTIAHALAERSLAENFRQMPATEYRRRLGQAAKDLGQNISVEELHQFLLEKLPKLLGNMFGWAECSITGFPPRDPDVH